MNSVNKVFMSSSAKRTMFCCSPLVQNVVPVTLNLRESKCTFALKPSNSVCVCACRYACVHACMCVYFARINFYSTTLFHKRYCRLFGKRKYGILIFHTGLSFIHIKALARG